MFFQSGGRSIMKAMIFAAGLGTRLKPLTDTMPKALVPLAGKSLLQWQVEQLRAAGITDIIVNVHHFPDMIIEAIRANNGWGCNISISDERDQLLDTGGGLKKIHNSYPRRGTIISQFTMQKEAVLACNVDILSNIDIKALVAQYERTGVSQLVVSERETQRYLLFDENDTLRGWTNIATGEVRPNGSDQVTKYQVTKYQEPRQSEFRKLAFSGMQILSPDVLDRLQEMKEDKFSLIDFYVRLCENNHQSPITNPQLVLKAYIPQNYQMMDVGKINQIEEAALFAEKIQKKL